MNRAVSVILAIALISPVQFAKVMGGEPVDQNGELDGVPYRIQIPAEWNGNLVMYTHSYQARGAQWMPLHQSLASVFLSRGFALAESAYSRQGWAVEEGLADTEDLRLHFIDLHGRPDSTFVAGHSLGGLIALATVETYPDAYDGALPMCGPLAPSLLYVGDYFFDLLVTFEAFFGEHLPEGAVPVIEAESLAGADVEKALSADSVLAVTYAANRGIRREELAGIIAMSHMLFVEIVDRAGGNPIDNRNTIYSDFVKSVDLNSAVRRYKADPGAADYLKKNYTPTGKPGGPVVALHTTYDAGVPTCLPGLYDTSIRLIDGGKWFVQYYAEADGHCRFTPGITGEAFDRLRRWVATGVKPEPGRLE